LRKAQRQIEALQREVARERAAEPPTAAPARQARDAAGPEGTTAAAPAAEPVDLLLEALRKRGTIAESDYRSLRAAIAAKRDDAERQAAESRRAAEVAKQAEAGARAAAAPPEDSLAIRAGYRAGKGLTFATEDGRFQVAIYNRIQGRYSFADQDDPAKDDASSFRVRRFKTVFEGHAFDPSLLYKFQVNWAGSPELEDALLHWRPRPYFGLQGGQYKLPFNRQQITSSGALQFVDRAITDDFFTFQRDQGLMLTGSWLGAQHDRVEWHAGIFNGNGINRASNENSDHLAVGRVLYMPLGKFNYYSESDVEHTPDPRFGVGVAGAFNSQADSTATEKARIFGSGRLGSFFGSDVAGRFDVAQTTADAHVKYRGLSLLGDYYWAEADPNAGASRRAWGYNAQAGYFLIPKRLEAAFRYAFVDRDAGEGRNLREVGGALGYFFFAHNLKIQADVRNVLDEIPGGADRDTMEYRAQVQAIF
jgi:phosphate-selective porin OprO/OprP